MASETKRAFITGITGQDGAYLAKSLLAKGYAVYGLHARRSTDTLWRLRDLGVAADVNLLEGDLNDLSALMRCMEKSAADEVYNLAAQSFVATSWTQPILTANAVSYTHLDVYKRQQVHQPACHQGRSGHRR